MVVVGGGPAGCHAAFLLGAKGFDVQLLEEHTVIGEPVDCSGVIGADAFTTLDLPRSLRQGEIRSITLVSPSGLKVRFSPPSPLAYVVDRAAFDHTVADRTEAAGVTVCLGSCVRDLEVKDDRVELIVEGAGDRQRYRVQASVVILAGGPRYMIQRKLGMGAPPALLKTAQVELLAKDLEETRVFLGSGVAPGSFGWIVPFRKEGRTFARIGVSGKKGAGAHLKRLLGRLHSDGHLSASDVPIRPWVIPVAPIRQTFADRILAVGDAAGQTKPITGGGIYYSLLCAEAAALTISNAFESGDFSARNLGEYECGWRKKLGREIKIGRFFRRLAENLHDGEIDDLFRIVQSDGIMAEVTRRARFDWHRDVIHFALRHPALGRIFLKGLFR